MGWVHRATDTPHHLCDLPLREATYSLIGPDTTQTEHRETVAAGHIGDLWRCDPCGRLWRIGYACDACDYYGSHDNPHRGMCTVGYKWRPASMWQRITHPRPRRRGENR